MEWMTWNNEDIKQKTEVVRRCKSLILWLDMYPSRHRDKELDQYRHNNNTKWSWELFLSTLMSGVFTANILIISMIGKQPGRSHTSRFASKAKNCWSGNRRGLLSFLFLQRACQFPLFNSWSWAFIFFTVSCFSFYKCGLWILCKPFLITF